MGRIEKLLQFLENNGAGCCTKEDAYKNGCSACKELHGLAEKARTESEHLTAKIEALRVPDELVELVGVIDNYGIPHCNEPVCERCVNFKKAVVNARSLISQQPEPSKEVE